MRIAISTGGGDAPGLNAVIRAAVLAATSLGWEVVGIQRGFSGLLEEGEVIALSRQRVRGIAHLGGTILGTTNRGNPFHYPTLSGDRLVEVDRSGVLIERMKEMKIDALISIGGDGSLTIAQKLHERGVNVVGVPKTIDNDVSGTITFGFDTAVNTAIEAIDKLHTTAESHDRVLVIEVMGRDAGFIALHSGVAASADVILIPEIPYSIERVCEKVRDRDRAGRRFSIIVVAEGAFPVGGKPSVLPNAKPGESPRLGGAGEQVAREIEAALGKECRSLVLGHLQRGGMPTGYDRLLATRFGAAAVRAVQAERWGEMVAIKGTEMTTIPISEALETPKRVKLSDDIVMTARAMGVSFGD